MQEQTLAIPLAVPSTLPPLQPAVPAGHRRRRPSAGCPSCGQGTDKGDAILQRWLDLSA
jgi:hypothetical protein